MPYRSLPVFPCFFSFPFEPFTDLLDKIPLYLPVWNYKFCQIPGLCTALCQIPGCKEDTPQIIRIGIKYPCESIPDGAFFYAVSINQLFDFISVCCFCFAQKFSYNIITARIYPVILQFCYTSVAQVAAVIDDIPWTVDAKTAKQITIIPFLYSIILACQSIILQHLSYFCIRKTKIFFITYILYSIYLKIIESGKNTFL